MRRSPARAMSGRRATLCVLAILCLLAFPATTSAQAAPEEEAVLAAVQRLFDAFAVRDTAALKAAFVDGGAFMSVTMRDGVASYGVTPRDRVVAQVAGAAEPWHERMWDARVEVHGPIAMVWTPYDFRVGDTFSHCGVDGFSLVRTADGWRVAWAIYTVEREGCDTS